MEISTTEKAVSKLIMDLDQKVWDSIALKAIQKIAPHKIKDESVCMFNDFTKLTSVGKGGSGTDIKQTHDLASIFKENFISGAAKSTQKTVKSRSQRGSTLSPIPHFYERQKLKKQRKTIKTQPTIQQKSPSIRKTANNFFKLTFQQPRNEKEDRQDDLYRNTKYSDQAYERSLEEASKELEIKRRNQTVTEAKRFKQMKVYTYDFEGRLIPMDQSKAGGVHNVLSMQPQLTEGLKKSKNNMSRKTSVYKANEIIEKRVINHEKQSLMELAKEKRQVQLEQEKIQRRQSFLKNISNNKFANMFNKDTRVSMGVSITDINDKSRVAGTERDKTDKKNLKLLQFKNRLKQTERFPMSSHLKIRPNYTSLTKTQGDEFAYSHERIRMKTQGNEGSSVRSTLYPRAGTSRGIIHIKHRKLYSQNFSQAQAS